MRNLKKILALVLALVMSMSLVSIASADFADDADIVNKEAANILYALGVVEGKGANKFDPKGLVKRGEMAKMITIITLGDVDVTAFKGTVTDLTDINGHWAEAYIKYCYSQGIISGKGAGKFAPDAYVTSAEAAKMLLVAIGYNANVQGYTGVGDQWSINVTRDAQLAGYYTNLAVASDANLTRDQAAQMIWNAVQANMIEKTTTYDRETGRVSDHYAPYGTHTDLLGETFGVKVWEGILTQFSYNSEKAEWTYDVDETGLTIVQASPLEVGTVVSVPSTTDYTDKFMNRVKILYTLDKDNLLDTVYGIYSVRSSVVAEGVVGAITDPAASATTVKINGKSYKLTGTASGIEIYEFGNKNTSAVTVADTLNDIDTYAADGSKASIYSCKLIDNTGDGEGDLLVTYPVSVEKVSYTGTKTFNTSATGGTATTNTLYGTTTAVEYSKVNTYEGLAKGDLVLVTEKGNTATNVETFAKLDVLSGKVTAVKVSDDLAQIDGVWYKTNLYAAHTFNAGDEFNYVIVNGYIVYSNNASSTKVKDMIVVTKSADEPDGVDATYSTKVLGYDGKSSVVEVVSIDGSSARPTAGTMYTYTVDNSGYYVLKSVTSANVTGFGFEDIASGGTGLGNNQGFTFVGNDGTKDARFTKGGTTYFINDDAVIFYYNGSSYSVMTGAKLNATTGGINKVLMMAGSTNNNTNYNGIEVAYIVAPSATSGTTLYGYVVDEPVKYEVNGKFYTEVKFWDGTATQTMVTPTGADSGDVTAAYALDIRDVFTYKINADGKLTNVSAKIAFAELDGSTSTGDLAIAAVQSYNGKETLTLSNNYFTAKTANSYGSYDGAATYEVTLDKDTVIIYVDSSKAAGAEGGAINLASSNLLTAVDSSNSHYYANVQAVVGTDDIVDLLVVDVNNDILRLQ